MPSFHSDAAENYQLQVDDFTGAYIYALYFTETEDGADDRPPTHARMHEDALSQCIEDCAEFRARFFNLLAEAYLRDGYDESQAGHDFWLTRNGHGAGFWDRGLGDAGTRLTEAAKAFGSIDVTYERNLASGSTGGWVIYL